MIRNVVVVCVVAAAIICVGFTSAQADDDPCFKCVVANCLDKTLVCANISGCGELVGCLKDCPGGSENSKCVAKCASGCSYAAKVAAKDALICQIAMCPKACFR